MIREFHGHIDGYGYERTLVGSSFGKLNRSNESNHYCGCFVGAIATFLLDSIVPTLLNTSAKITLSSKLCQDVNYRCKTCQAASSPSRRQLGLGIRYGPLHNDPRDTESVPGLVAPSLMGFECNRVGPAVAPSETTFLTWLHRQVSFWV